MWLVASEQQRIVEGAERVLDAISSSPAPEVRQRAIAVHLLHLVEMGLTQGQNFDLEALSAAGVPVYPQPGRGGGWSLVGGARTDLSGLSATEAQASPRAAAFSRRPL